jgi:hypothetical protein
MAEPAVAEGAQELRSLHQAMLVIHGIGEQNPYETLDSFARGVFRHLVHTRGFNAKLCPIEFAHKDWTQVGMRIGIIAPGRKLPECPEKDGPAPKAEGPDAYIDLFEYYWAPETEDKLSAVETLKWVLKTDFEPLRYFADNLQLQMRLPGSTKLGAIGRSVATFARELGRVFIYYVPLMLGIAALLAWISNPARSWASAFKTVTPNVIHFLTPEHAGILLLYLLGLLMIWFGLQEFWEWRRHPGDAIDDLSDTLWLIGDVLLAGLFLGAALWIDCHFRLYVGFQALAGIFGNGHWKPIAGAAIAAITSYALTAYVADVAVYVNADPKSKNYKARNAILEGSTAALKMLLGSDAYDRVILAGHSLGSVIAYDTINELLAERNAEPRPKPDQPDPYLDPAQLQKLKGLLTFGSPLDKIYYFFREHVKRDQAVRAQILSMLYSFRKKRAGRTYGEFQFNYSFDQLDELEWLNAWACLDPVSGRLNFYHVNDQRQFCYAVPVLAHLSYWSDPDFYEYFASRLLYKDS